MEFLVILGKVIGFIFYIYILAKAWMNDDKGWFIGSLFIGVLAFVYCILNWSELKVPFLVLLGCIILILVGST